MDEHSFTNGYVYIAYKSLKAQMQKNISFDAKGQREQVMAVLLVWKKTKQKNTISGTHRKNKS